MGKRISVEQSPMAIAEELGERLKLARLNQNMSQSEVADFIGISRRSVINAEKGKAQLEVFVAILSALDLTSQLDLFLPRQHISPIQLAKLEGKTRQRASRKQHSEDDLPEELDW